MSENLHQKFGIGKSVSENSVSENFSSEKSPRPMFLSVLNPNTNGFLSNTNGCLLTRLDSSSRLDNEIDMITSL